MLISADKVKPVIKSFGFEDIDLDGVGIAMLIIFLAVAVAVSVFFYLYNRKNGNDFTTRDLTYAAVCLASAYTLSFFGLKMLNGGTITLASSLPIMIFCYYKGFYKGFILSTAYMLLQLLQGPFIVSPFSGLLDYIFPYMLLSVTGIFCYKPELYKAAREKNSPVLTAHIRFFIGAGIYALGRYASHFLSGIIFFRYGAGLAEASVVSLVYNLSMLIDAGIAILAGAFLLCSKNFNAFMTVSFNRVKNADTAAKND